MINYTNKNNNGISAIVLFENQRTFNLLKNEFKTILKNRVVFETRIDYTWIKIFLINKFKKFFYKIIKFFSILN